MTPERYAELFSQRPDDIGLMLAEDQFDAALRAVEIVAAEDGVEFFDIAAAASKLLSKGPIIGDIRVAVREVLS
jgi:hypothetical protein